MIYTWQFKLYPLIKCWLVEMIYASCPVSFPGEGIHICLSLRRNTLWRIPCFGSLFFYCFHQLACHMLAWATRTSTHSSSTTVGSLLFLLLHCYRIPDLAGKARGSWKEQNQIHLPCSGLRVGVRNCPYCLHCKPGTYSTGWFLYGVHGNRARDTRPMVRNWCESAQQPMVIWLKLGDTDAGSS